jgi:hypothetical protein
MITCSDNEVHVLELRYFSGADLKRKAGLSSFLTLLSISVHSCYCYEETKKQCLTKQNLFFITANFLEQKDSVILIIKCNNILDEF